MQHPELNMKLVGGLLSMAFVSAVLFIAALLYSIPAAHAQEMVFGSVAIEDGALRPLALTTTGDVKIDSNVPLTYPLGGVRYNFDGTVAGPGMPGSASTTNTTMTAEVKSAPQPETTYRAPARLFGFIPTTLSVKTGIDASGSVKTYYPWYSFLFVKSATGLMVK